MKINACGRSALMIATGLFVCFAGPALAAGGDSGVVASKSASATAGKAVKHGARHWKRHAHRKHHRKASKSAEAAKAADTKAPDKDTADASSAAAEIPASVANANAEMTSGDPAADGAKAMSSKAGMILQATAEKPAEAQAPASAEVVASDQLNDVDRALQETPSAAPQTVGAAPIKLASTGSVQASSETSSSWEQASLIGKIFIGFGALLTLASAARMFMA